MTKLSNGSSFQNFTNSLPIGWSDDRLGNIASIIVSNVDKKIVDGEQLVKLCNYVDVYYNNCISLKIQFMDASASLEQIARFCLQVGDVIITKDSESPHDIGIPALVTETMANLVCGYHLTILRANPSLIYGPYLFYALRSLTSSYQCYLAANGVTRYGLTLQGVKNLKIWFPGIFDQKKITKFLDVKLTIIDALIAKKKDLIEKLKENRLAVITQAVTKGLNLNKEFVDSGSSWLGTVPCHWEVKPVKFLTKIFRGQFSHRPRNDPAFYGGDYPFVQTGDVARAGKYVKTYSQTLNERGLAVSKMFPSGTLVMTIAANIGDMAIIEFPACFPDSIVGFVPECNINLDYLYYLFVAMKPRLMMTAVLNTQLNLNIDRIATIEAVEPPLLEQQAIVDYLNQRLSEVQAVMEKTESAISYLVEYRTALITAATTGKIDVRNVRIPEPAAV